MRRTKRGETAADTKASVRLSDGALKLKQAVNEADAARKLAEGQLSRKLGEATTVELTVGATTTLRVSHSGDVHNYCFGYHSVEIPLQAAAQLRDVLCEWLGPQTCIPGDQP